MKTLRQLFTDQRGATMMEYSLISGIIALATIVTVAVLEVQILMMAAP